MLKLLRPAKILHLRLRPQTLLQRLKFLCPPQTSPRPLPLAAQALVPPTRPGCQVLKR